jgi:uncharacterized membrane-anchored protein YitT (DUF2179 family)
LQTKESCLDVFAGSKSSAFTHIWICKFPSGYTIGGNGNGIHQRRDMHNEQIRAHFAKVFAHFWNILWLVAGCALAAFAIKIFFIPNNLIDGGTVGLAMILSRLIGVQWLPVLIVFFTLPFVVFASKVIGRMFVISTIIAVSAFAACLFIIPHLFHTPFYGDAIEVVVIGGGILGVGIGIIIRCGGCLDGTEILGLIANRRWGFTVGQIVFFCNIIVFSTAGLVFQAWHPPLMSLITYIVVARVLDFVLVGLDETKSVLVISSKYKDIEKAVMHELGIGLTVMYGRGGFSGESREILYIITERLRLTELKELIYSIDPMAFIAIESLHEVSSGRNRGKAFRKKKPSKRRLLFQSE